MDYDELLKNIGEFGLYQRKLYFTLVLVSLPVAIHNLNIVFIAAEPDFWCSVPDADHLTANLTHEQWLNLTAPKKEVDGDWVHDACKRYSYNFSMLSIDGALGMLQQGHLVDTGQEECKAWNYDTSQYTSSIVTEWDLVCERAALVPTSKSVYMAGLMVGVLLFGTIADTFGRKPSLAVALCLQIILGISVAFSLNLIVFLVLRFLLAAANIAVFTIVIVMVIEMVGPSGRVFAGIAIGYFWACGYVLLAGLAYLMRDWVHLQLVCSVPWVLLFAILFYASESPRWLYTRGKKDQADAIVEKMAKENKTSLPAKLEITIQKCQKTYVWDLLRYSTLRLRTLNIWFNWFVISMVYYGISLSSSALGGNDYLSFFILGLIEFPAYLFSQISLSKLGRRRPLATTMVTGGVALLLTIPVPKDMTWVIIILAVIGKFCVTASFAIIYVFSAELFPTVVRSIGVGSGSFWARIGGILAPFIANLAKDRKVIPLIIFGALSLVAGLLALLLPETKDKILPSTMDDADKFGRKEIRNEEKNGLPPAMEPPEPHSNPAFIGKLNDNKF